MIRLFGFLMAEADAAESGDRGEFPFSAMRRIHKRGQGPRDVLGIPVKSGEELAALLLEIIEAQEAGHAGQPVCVLCAVRIVGGDCGEAVFELSPEAGEGCLALGLSNQGLQPVELLAIQYRFHGRCVLLAGPGRNPSEPMHNAS
jgi:hypothetical protein